MSSAPTTTPTLPSMRSSTAGDEQPDHCVFCHWLRAMSSAEMMAPAPLVMPCTSPAIRSDPAEAKRIGEEAAATVLSNDLIEGFEVVVG